MGNSYTVGPNEALVVSADDACVCWYSVSAMTDEKHLDYACEQFLGKSVDEIESTIQQTFEGHLRAVLEHGGSVVPATEFKFRFKFCSFLPACL